MAKLEAEVAESLRTRDKVITAMTKAELALEEANLDPSHSATREEAPAGRYAEDMYEKAEAMLKEARLALETKEYGRAESLVEQARVSASSAQAISKAKEIEIREKEAQEDAKANALDAVAKAERTMASALSAGAVKLADDSYNQAQTALDQARQAVSEGNFGEALSLAQKSISHSTTALAMAEAKSAHERKVEEIESEIAEEAGKIPETTVRRTNRGVVVSMGGVLFAQGSSQIRREAQPRLEMLAELLKKYPEYKVIIEGHTDSIGSEEANLKISTERAYNFLRYMADREGIPLERLSSVGYGESRPIASNINEAGRRQNRRVDTVILTAPVSP
jgi:outer membrane protein OmpA-like peptidoglycan-associated protein